MRTSRVTISILFMAALAGVACSGARQGEPRTGDRLWPVTLTQAELAGEIGRRIDDLIYKNYMALDLDGFFIAPFR